MAVTKTQTVRDICTKALVKARIVGIGRTPSARYMTQAREELELMLKGWQNNGFFLWSITGVSIPATTSASYTLTPTRPLSIANARFRQSGRDLPMQPMTRQEYDDLPVKTSTGIPTTYYYDRQREDAVFYVWPVLSAANGETIEIAYERELEDIDSANDVLDMPGEWWEATVYNLAARLMETVPLQRQSTIIPQRAQMLLDEALAFDREGSVFFAGPYAV